MLTLALESSCDETAVAILRGPAVLASVIASQIELHRPTGGVVPEVASRSHLEALRPLLHEALNQAQIRAAELDQIAATAGPGLASSLLVGHTAAKGLALALGKPFHAINHLEGHLLSPFIGQAEIPPHLALVVSGGHTLLVEVQDIGQYYLLGRSRDDAAGEAFDKVGKLLGLPYPGGPEIEKTAHGGNPLRFDLPRGTVADDPFAFSFSGLKTAVLYRLPQLRQEPEAAWLADLCASFQHTVTSVLVERLIAAAHHSGQSHVTLSGGVACNDYLRHLATQAAEQAQLQLHLCQPRWSTDNAAMIGYAAWARQRAHLPPSPLEQDIDPNLPLALNQAGQATPNRSAKAQRLKP